MRLLADECKPSNDGKGMEESRVWGPKLYTGEDSYVIESVFFLSPCEVVLIRQTVKERFEGN